VELQNLKLLSPSSPSSPLSPSSPSSPPIPTPHSPLPNSVTKYHFVSLRIVPIDTK
ncbi:hypothetical protein H1Q63_25660, partial [Desmonostoc muscorum CCALA 125]|nr:hypothetical protein [Desmonostoc muscorum CCALA 125]